jgi:hypothetical protein
MASLHVEQPNHPFVVSHANIPYSRSHILITREDYHM